MASKTINAAYLLFTVSIFVWLSALLSVCFPSGSWAVPIRFLDSSIFALFFGSAAVAAASCFLIGLNYIGLDFKIRQRSQQVLRTSKSSATVAVSRLGNVASMQEADFPVFTQEDETTGIIIVPPLEKEQIAN
jgi:hypothetical protein